MSLVYNEFKDQLGQAAINLLTADVRVQAIDLADYTPAATHEFLDSVPAGARVGTAVANANPTLVNGLYDFDDVTLLGVTGDEFEAILIYIHTGVDATSRLICLITTESDGSTPIAFTPNGSDIDVSFPNGVLQL